MVVLRNMRTTSTEANAIAKLQVARKWKTVMALMVAKALGALPRLSVIVGCQPAEIEVLRIGLSDIVAAAVPLAVAEVERCIAEFIEAFA